MYVNALYIQYLSTEDLFWIMKVDHFGNFDYLRYIGFQYYSLFDTLGNKKTQWDIANESYGYILYKSLIPPCCYKCLKYNFGQTRSLSPLFTSASLFLMYTLLTMCVALGRQSGSSSNMEYTMDFKLSLQLAGKGGLCQDN